MYTISLYFNPVHNIFEQLLVCGEERLCEFTSPDSTLDISDLLISAGYPHISVTADSRRLAYECCLIHEVITKRIPALDDIRKGLESVKFWGKSALDLMSKCPDIQTRFFPAPEAEVVDVATLRSQFVYEEDDNAASQEAQKYFEKYLDELGSRGCIIFLSVPY